MASRSYRCRCGTAVRRALDRFHHQRHRHIEERFGQESAAHIAAGQSHHLVGVLRLHDPVLGLAAGGRLLHLDAVGALCRSGRATVLQKVVPLERQGRVFGFAQSVEQAASPLTAFLIGPLTQFVVIPFMTDGAGADTIGGWFGMGPARGIAFGLYTCGCDRRGGDDSCAEIPILPTAIDSLCGRYGRRGRECRDNSSLTSIESCRRAPCLICQTNTRMASPFSGVEAEQHRGE